MERQLTMQRLENYNLLFDSDLFQEETLEIIVPDSREDIKQISYADGQIRLTGKTTRDGTITLEGVVDCWILYEPESDHGICKMEASIPFTLRQDVQGLTGECVCTASPVVRTIDCRLLNPRKILLKADLGAGIKLYQWEELKMSADIMSDATDGIQMLKKDITAFLVRDVKEKEFTVYDEIRLQNGPSDICEIVGTSIKAVCSQSKVIGNKLVLKGEARAVIRYVAEDRVCCTSTTIPFSQILDTDSAGEESDCAVTLCVTSVNCTSTGADSRTIELSIDLLAQAVMRDKCPLTVLLDAYSTKMSLSAAQKELQLPQLLEHTGCTKNICETIQTQEKVRTVLDSSVSCVQVRQSREGDNLCLEGQLVLRVLFTDDLNMLHSLERVMHVSGTLDNPNHAVSDVDCICPGEIYVNTTAEGVELRFDVEFRWLMTDTITVHIISSVELEELNSHEQTNKASVILSMTGQNERLWDIAKRYRTTQEAIRRANELSDEKLPAGKMLLIPANI